MTCLYVADGHHRTAAAYNLGKMRREEALAKGQKVTGEEPFNYFMSICYPADNLLIMDYNRVIKNLKGLDSATFLKKLEEICDISKLESSTSPDKKGKFSLLLDSDWYSLTPKQKQSGIDS